MVLVGSGLLGRLMQRTVLILHGGHGADRYWGRMVSRIDGQGAYRHHRQGKQPQQHHQQAQRGMAPPYPIKPSHRWER